MRGTTQTLLMLVVSSLPTTVLAQLYSYHNADGDYVISKTRPEGNIEYAILSDDGEFVRLVRKQEGNVPLSHWRPWYLPREPHHLDGPTLEPSERTPNVTVDEVEADSRKSSKP